LTIVNSAAALPAVSRKKVTAVLDGLSSGVMLLALVERRRKFAAALVDLLPTDAIHRTSVFPENMHQIHNSPAIY
jgi:hypothetical protein